LTVADTFRIGCIGDINRQQMETALLAIESTLNEMGVQGPAPVSVTAPAV